MEVDKIKDYFETNVAKGKIIGAVCAVFESGKELYRGVFGYLDCAKTKQLKGNEFFRLASMTKPITATAILILQERGLLNIDDTIGTYIAGFNHGGVGELIDGSLCVVKTAREITIRDCLCHASGLGSGVVGDYQLHQRKTPFDLAENVLAWNGALLDFEPKIKQAYSAIVAFELLAYIVEIVSKMPFESFLQKEIFEPLGMKETIYLLAEENKQRLVEMTKTNESGALEAVDLGYRGFGAFAEGYTGGSAGLFSTLDDYARFACMLSQRGVLGDVRILKEETIEQMRTPQHDYSIPGINEYFNWGLGVRVVEKQDVAQALPAGSYGWSGAYGTHFWVEPTTKRYAVLMLNKADVGGSGSPYSYEFEKLVQGIFDNKG